MERKSLAIVITAGAIALVGTVFSLAPTRDLRTLAAEPGGGNAKTESGPSIVPLYGHVEVAPMPDVNDLNQCAGTVQHYKLPPVGYTPAPESDASRKGKQLYENSNCASCHSIERKGGTLGPPLDGIGGARGKQFLVARLLDPAQQMRDFPEIFGGRPNIMPHPGITKKEASQIAQFLLTLKEPEGGFLITAHPAIDQPVKPRKEEEPRTQRERKLSAEKGKQLFTEHACAMCHTVEGAGGRFGPGLDGISLRRDRESLERLLAGQTNEPGMKARTMELSAQEAENMIEFLLSLPPNKQIEPREL